MRHFNVRHSRPAIMNLVTRFQEHGSVSDRSRVDEIFLYVHVKIREREPNHTHSKMFSRAWHLTEFSVAHSKRRAHVPLHGSDMLMYPYTVQTCTCALTRFRRAHVPLHDSISVIFTTNRLSKTTKLCRQVSENCKKWRVYSQVNTHW